MTEETRPTILLDDSSASVNALDFDPYTLTIADLITSENTRMPLTIGVFGPWGSGKTSLMGMPSAGLPVEFRRVWVGTQNTTRKRSLGAPCS